MSKHKKAIAMMLLGLLAILSTMYTHRKVVTEAVIATRASTRRRLIEHLRANKRGLVLLDFVLFTDNHVEGNVTVLGDQNAITGCYIRGGYLDPGVTLVDPR